MKQPFITEYTEVLEKYKEDTEKCGTMALCAYGCYSLFSVLSVITVFIFPALVKMAKIVVP